LRLRMELFTHDLEKSVRFFEEIIGLKLNRMDGTYADLGNGSVEIGIGLFESLPETHPLKTKGSERIGLGVEIVLEFPDIEKKYKEVAASGYPIESHLTKQAWGSKDFRLLDPNGYYIRLTEE
jgi:lactoylglutathione lyase